MRIRKKIEEVRMKKEAEQLLKEIEKYPELKDLQPPANLKERVYAEIERREKKLKESLSEEQQELIRMGIRYKKQQKSRKFVAVAVMVILLLSIGMTSLGGAEKVFYRISSMFMNRSREGIDSGKVEIIGNANEEEAYSQIEEKLGFNPVRLGHIPQGIAFQESLIFEDMPAAQIKYGTTDTVVLIYFIKPNYLKGSLAKDYEDVLIEDTQVVKDDVIIDIKEYQVEKEDKRWLITYEYKEIFYSLYIMNICETEVKGIIENIFFY